MKWTKSHEAALHRARTAYRPTREVMGEWFGKPRPPRQASPYLARAGHIADPRKHGADAPILHGLEPQGDEP